MPDKKSDSANPSEQRLRALSRWDNEGGAGPLGPQVPGDTQFEVPQLTNAELVPLRTRVIALENLVIALLAGASDRQLVLAREMSAYISPRLGFTPHPLTIHAAGRMLDIVERSAHFREG
jgi:hypothetical protein